MLKLRRGPRGSNLVAGSWKELRGTEGFTGNESVLKGPRGWSDREPIGFPVVTWTLAFWGFWGAENPEGKLGEPFGGVGGVILGDPLGGVGGVMIGEPHPCFCSGVFGALEKLEVALKRSFSVL
jgi:hypothetical protein